jgi:hypothetical protein
MLLVLSHIPIPGVVYKAQVSDKALHFVAYVILVFLLWFALRPDSKVNWRSAAVWGIILLLGCYSGIDEVLQGYVGRNCDIRDFSANMAGVLAGLALFSFLSFWPAMLAVSGVSVFILTNLAKVNPFELIPVASIVFYGAVYGFFALVWVRCIDIFLRVRARQLSWLLAALALPAALLVSVEVFSVIVGRGLRPSRMIGSAAGGIVLISVIMLVSRRGCKEFT